MKKVYRKIILKNSKKALAKNLKSDIIIIVKEIRKEVKRMNITLGTETLLGKVSKIYYGKCYIIHGKYADIILSHDEVLKIIK